MAKKLAGYGISVAVVLLNEQPTSAPVSPFEHIHQLMCEIGPATGAQQVTGSAEDRLWQVVLDGEAVFDLEYDAAFERVVISARIGALPRARREQVCTLFLNVNFAWRETDGVRIAVDPRTDGIVMMFEMPVSVLGLARLCTVLCNLRAKLNAWRQIVLGAATMPLDATDARFEGSLPVGAPIA